MSTRSTIHNFQPGDTFHDRYTLERVIGSGGFADVWKATDNITKTVVALKIYTNLDDDGIKDLSEEYSQVQGINHTNILKANHFDRWGQLPYLVMKFCSGGSLDKQINKLDGNEILNMIEQIASGLKYLHANGIVHQDIKPANILIDELNGNHIYVLSDFGISTKTKTRLSHSVQMTNQGGVSMTEGYAPPEKFSPKRDDRRANPKGDIFSFGITVYELVTGHLPFDEISTGRQLQYENVEVDFSEIENDKIRQVVEACMTRSRDERPDAATLEAMMKKPVMPPPIVAGGGGGNNGNGGNGGFPGGDIDINGGFPGGDIDMEKSDKKKDKKSKKEKSNNSTTRINIENGEAKRHSGGGKSGQGIKIAAIVVAVVAVICIAALFFLNKKDAANESYIAQVDTLLVNGIPIEMVKIPGGEFMMGAVDKDQKADTAETPAMKRRVKDFYMARTEVTQKLWESVMGENPSTIKGEDLPVNNVSAHDVDKFIQRLNTKLGVNFRLPTESEWEYVAKCQIDANGKVTDKSYLYAGTDKEPASSAWFKSNSGGTLHPVASKDPNSFGLYDLGGNVIEWCSDTYINYSNGSPVIDDKEQVLRGGWFDAPLDQMRSSNRGSCRPDERHPEFGLRLVY